MFNLKFWEPKNKSSIPDKDATLVSRIDDPAAWFIDMLNGRKTISGETVNQKTSMELDSYYAAVRNISEDIAKLPMNIFEKVKNGKKLDNDHFAYDLLHNFANLDMSSMDLFQTILHWAIPEGNGLAEIVRDRAGRAVQMWPIHPSRAQPFYNKEGFLTWRIRGSSDIRGKEKEMFAEISDEDIFNLRGLGGDGIIGYPLYVMASDSIGQGLATQKHASSYYGNATAFSGALVADQALDEKQYKRMRKSWAKKFTGGAKNQHQLAILEAGLKFVQMSSNANDAQLLEAQKFTVERMARLLRIPPHKIGHNAGMAKGNLESENISYHSDTLTPWIKRISLECKRKILRDPKFSARHEVNALTLGDSKTRAGVFKTYMNMGVISINEVRRLERMNVIDKDWADQHYIQMNITTVESVANGDNLKPKGAGQMGAPSGESGISTNSDSDPVEIDMADKFDKCKTAHLPSFKHAAEVVTGKESYAISRKLKSFMNDETGFNAWANTFYEKLQADIVRTFTPCCEVFINTFDVDDVELNAEFLAEFASNYAEEGKGDAAAMWNNQSEGKSNVVNLEEKQLKLSNSVINMIGMSAKGEQE